MYSTVVSSAAIALLALPLLTHGQTAKQEDNPLLLLSPDSSNHFEIIVGASEAVYGGADIGPILGIAKDLQPYAGNFTAWSSKWYELASQTKAQAEDPRFAYDPVNVRDAWFAAASYFRRADFYNHGNWSDPRINNFWAEQTAAFDKGLAALPVPGRRLRIPADNFTVEAIWYPACSESDSNVKRPTLILGNGYDGAQEDLYVLC